MRLPLMGFAATALLACTVCCHAQGRQQETEKTDSTSVADVQTDTTFLFSSLTHLIDDLIELMTIDRQRWSLGIYPCASYSGRTGLEIGIMPLLQLRSDKLPRPTTITPSCLVSTKRLFEVQCDIDIYLPHSVSIEGRTEIFKMPDLFYAVGNGENKREQAEYIFWRSMLTADIMKGIGDNGFWRMGITIDADYYKFSDIEYTDTTAIAEVDDVLGRDGGGNYGMGVVAGYDSRNDVLQPSRGSYVRLRTTGYANIFGSHHRYGIASLDARHYISLPLLSTLALQAYISGSWGDAPFVKKPIIGGTRLGRAIDHSLKYVDKQAWLLQCEWRVPLFWRIGASAFTAIGNVADRISRQFTNMHLMCGGGLRFEIFKGKGLKGRIDFGISNHGDKAMYFNIREAF